jgi:hypothetical protein
MLKRYLTLAGAGLGAAGLVVSSLLATAGPAQAVGDGTLVVNIVDQFGRPTSGIVQAYSATGGGQYPNSVPVASSTQTLTVPADGYGLATITPWSGFTCAGLSPCGLISPPTTVTPAITVSDGSTTTYTAHVTVPSITGSPAIGSPLAVQIPQGLSDLLALLASVPQYAGPVTQQWVRGTTDIPGATGTSYTTVRDDGSQAMSARLAPSLGMVTIFASTGMPVQPLSTNAITVAKAVKFKTKTKASIAKRLKVNERATVKVKVKAKGSKDDPDGFVTLTIGKFKARKALKGGIVFINLPPMKAGTYTISTKYAGSDAFAKSKGKKTTIIVG